MKRRNVHCFETIEVGARTTIGHAPPRLRENQIYALSSAHEKRDVYLAVALLPCSTARTVEPQRPANRLSRSIDFVNLNQVKLRASHILNSAIRFGTREARRLTRTLGVENKRMSP